MYLKRFAWVGGFVLLVIFGFVAIGVNGKNSIYRLFIENGNRPYIIVEDQFVIS